MTRKLQIAALLLASVAMMGFTGCYQQRYHDHHYGHDHDHHPPDMNHDHDQHPPDVDHNNR